MLIVSASALFLSMAQYRRQPELRIFFYYTLFSLITDLTDLYRALVGVNEHFPFLVQAWSNLFFAIYEFLIFIYFIFRQVSGRGRRRTLRVLTVSYLGYLLFTITLAHKLLTEQSLYFTESILVTIASLLYFYELFTQTPEDPLKTQPAFWIITGILLLNCCSLPLYLTMAFLGKYYIVSYNLVYVLYTVFFCLMMRAYLCQPREWATRRFFLLFKG